MLRFCFKTIASFTVNTPRLLIGTKKTSSDWSKRLMEDPDKILENVSVLYRSDNYLVIDKQYDILINSDDPEQLLTVEHQLRKKYPELVDHSVKHGFRFQHRLDLATSGVLCLSLNKPASAKFFKLIQAQQMRKHYLALVRGHVAAPCPPCIQHIEAPIGRDGSITEFCKMCTTDNTNCTKPLPAHTGLVVLQHGSYDGQPASKVLLIPYTGRTHQLRVHCQSRGHLIVGDYTYSNRADTKPYRMMLHAYRLVAPLSGELIDVIAPDPFVQRVDKLWSPEQTFVTYEEFLKLEHEDIRKKCEGRDSPRR